MVLLGSSPIVSWEASVCVFLQPDLMPLGCAKSSEVTDHHPYCIGFSVMRLLWSQLSSCHPINSQVRSTKLEWNHSHGLLSAPSLGWIDIHPRLPGEASYKLLCTSCVLFYLILTIADQINTSIDSICGRLNQATNSLAFLPQRDEREIISTLKLCGL